MQVSLKAIALAAGVAVGAAGAASAAEIKLMTGPQGGSWIPLGGQLKDLWEKSVPGLTVQSLPGAGIANVRGQLLPILDLRQYLGSGVTPNSRNVRVIVVNHREVPAGLLVDEVLGFRRFSESEFTGDAPPTVVRCERYLAGAFKRGPEQWPVLSLRQLVESPSFQEAAA